MSKGLAVLSEGLNLPAALGPDLAAAIDLAKAEKAASTRKAYGTDFRLFREWCEARSVSALPAAPETVAAYLAAHASTSKASTLGRRVAAIRGRGQSVREEWSRSSVNLLQSRPRLRECGSPVRGWHLLMALFYLLFPARWWYVKRTGA